MDPLHKRNRKKKLVKTSFPFFCCSFVKCKCIPIVLAGYGSENLMILTVKLGFCAIVVLAQFYGNNMVNTVDSPDVRFIIYIVIFNFSSKTVNSLVLDIFMNILKLSMCL